MDEHVLVILAADEEGRARAAGAARSARVRVEEARTARDERRAQRLRAEQQAFDEQVQAIRAEAEAVARRRQGERERALAALAGQAEGRLAPAAQIFARIVSEGPGPRGRP